MSDLKPCKKHNRMPYLKEVHIEPLQNYHNNLFNKRFEYVCDACELEKYTARKQPLIDEWNRKQEQEPK